MDEKGLELSLHIMEHEHIDANLLAVVVLKGLPVYLLLESNQNSCDEHRPKVFNQENKLPGYLHPQVLEN